MKIFGGRKKKSLQERKLALIQQIKEIEIQLNSMKVRDPNSIEKAISFMVLVQSAEAKNRLLMTDELFRANRSSGRFGLGK